MDLPANADSPRKRVLLVEDDVDQAHLVKFLLEADGTLGVTLAQDGIRGVKLLEEQDWDLLITDINLPGADGVEVVEASRRFRPSVPILATTGYTGPEYGARARDRGADAVLIKPLDRDDLLHHVHVLLAGASPEGAGAGQEVDALESASERGTPGAQEPASERGSPDALESAWERDTTDALGPASEPESTAAPAPGGSGRDVLALSVRPGDAEVGCGAALLAHSGAGDRVVLLHLSSGPHRPETGEDPDRNRDAIKAAGTRLGARTFVATGGGSGDQALLELGRLVSGAIEELRPDVLYLPTAHHERPEHRAVNRAGCDAGSDVPTILGYDPGDATSAFAPDHFVPLPEAPLRKKLEATAGYDGWGLEHLKPTAVRAAASFWARFAGGSPAEALETLKAPPGGPRLPRGGGAGTGSGAAG